jgi:hypothetical protein
VGKRLCSAKLRAGITSPAPSLLHSGRGAKKNPAPHASSLAPPTLPVSSFLFVLFSACIVLFSHAALSVCVFLYQCCPPPPVPSPPLWAYWGPFMTAPLCAPPSRHASSSAPLSAVELEPELTKEALSNNIFSGGERVELDPREAGAGATSGWRATPN